MIALVFGFIALAVIAAAAVCNATFTRRLAAGRVTRGKASAVTLLVLLITPSMAAVVATAAVAGRPGLVYPAMLYFYAGYAVGLPCFIVLNRRFRRIGGA